MEIKKAWLNAVKEYHPDANTKHKELYNCCIIKINAAYNELSDTPIQANPQSMQLYQQAVIKGNIMAIVSGIIILRNLWNVI